MAKEKKLVAVSFDEYLHPLSRDEEMNHITNEMEVLRKEGWSIEGLSWRSNREVTLLVEREQ